MANILFKRGAHNQLPNKDTGAIDGAFYLTTDSHRLYAGIGTKLVDLNQYIRIAESLESMKTWTDVQEGDFGYIINGNILAIYHNGAWGQINTNTNNINESISFKGNKETDPGVLTITLTDDQGHSIEQTLEFIGTNGTDVTVEEDGTIKVDGAVYSIGAALTDDTYTITLNCDDDEVTDTSIALKAGANINFTTDSNGVLEISTPDEINLNSDKGASASVSANDKGDIAISVTDTAGFTVSDTASGSIYYKVGKNKTTVYNQNDLEVYTIGEIDDLFATLNPMSYKGTVGSEAELTGKTNVKAGDTYMANKSFSSTLSSTGLVKVGDIFIATGTENANGILDSVTWTYVPSGDEPHTDTEYEATVDTSENKITFTDTTEGDVMSVISAIGDADTSNKISVTSTTDTDSKELHLKVEHKTPGNGSITPTEALPASDALSITAVDSLVIDSTGHVASLQTKTHSLASYTLSGATTSVADNKVTVTDTLVDSAGNDRGTSSFVIDASADDNLNVTATGNTVTIQLEWGSFN